MAIKEHVEKLKQGKEAWNRWRQEVPGARPDLSYMLDTEEFGNQERNPSFGAWAHKETRPILRHFNLDDVNFEGSDLSWADLSATSCRRTRFTKAILKNVECKQADLSSAQFIESLVGEGGIGDDPTASFELSVLAGANFLRADLRWVYFGNANLANASIRDCRCEGTNFQGCNLSGVSAMGSHFGSIYSSRQFYGSTLKGAEIGACVLSGLDLSATTGLASVTHALPSIVDVSTLENSSHIPDGDESRRLEVEDFFRGCGIPEHLLEYYQSRSIAPLNVYTCFISYSSDDSRFAEEIYDFLKSRGIRYWLDKHDIFPGQDLYSVIDRGIRICDKMILCCSEKSLASHWVRVELDKALEKERRSASSTTGVPGIIPLDLDGAIQEWKDGRASIIRSRSCLDFTGWRENRVKFMKQAEVLAKGLSRKGLGR